MAAIDLYVVAGQSNAEGRGNSALSPAVVGGSLMWTGAALVALHDPVGGATTGSAWPAFANAYYMTCRTPVCIVEAATGGTGLMANTGGGDDWSTGGSLFGAAVTLGQEARRALINAGWSITLRGVLWHQGERDSLGYPGDIHNLRDNYQAALSALIDRFQAAFGTRLGLYVFRLGRPNSADDEGFVQVRLAQGNAAAVDPDIHLVHTRAVDFPGLGWMTDEYHYTQDGYNDMGTTAGPLVAHLARAGALHGDGQDALLYTVDSGALVPSALTAVT